MRTEPVDTERTGTEPVDTERTGTEPVDTERTGTVNGTVHVVPSVADAFAALAVDALSQPHAGDGHSLFLSGGPTARSAYEQLAAGIGASELRPGDRRPGSTGDVDWSTINAYWGDERCVPLDHPDSNHRLGHEALLDRVGPVRSDHPMYRSGPPGDAAASYQHTLAQCSSFDIIHLGMGPDGHCASLFPGSAALDIDDPSVLVVATRDPNDANPHDRITLTFPAIARARLVIVTVSGPTKREAFARIVAGDDLPAGRIAAGEVVWLVDNAAAVDATLPAT